MSQASTKWGCHDSGPFSEPHTRSTSGLEARNCTVWCLRREDYSFDCVRPRCFSQYGTKCTQSECMHCLYSSEGRLSGHVCAFCCGCVSDAVWTELFDTRFHIGSFHALKNESVVAMRLYFTLYMYCLFQLLTNICWELFDTDWRPGKLFAPYSAKNKPLTFALDSGVPESGFD